MPLTEKRIRDARPEDKTRFEWDDASPGLGLRITAAGAKALVLDYYVDGRRRRMTLGRCSELSLAEARRRAAEYRQGARDGTDPLDDRRARRELPTVSNALDRFLDEHIPRRRAIGRMAERTEREYRRQIERHLRPDLGRLRVRDAKQEHIEKMLAPLPPIMANRIRALTSKLFRLCEDWGWREQNSNPARGIEKAVEEARDRTLSADELSALGRALSAMEETANPGAVLAIRLGALTGLRLNEVQRMRWSDLDLKGGYLTLPTSKTGRRVHTLPAAARALLAQAPHRGDFVIPGRTGEKPLDVRLIQRTYERACATAGIRASTYHDLRRTIMTQAAAMGVGAHLLRDMVGHKTTAMADRYIRAAGEPLTDLRERVGAGIAAQLEGVEPAPPTSLRK